MGSNENSEDKYFLMGGGLSLQIQLQIHLLLKRNICLKCLQYIELLLFAFTETGRYRQLQWRDKIPTGFVIFELILDVYS